MRLVPALLLLALLPLSVARAAPSSHLTGQVAGFRLAGIEPDGDPLDQVALVTRLGAQGNRPPLRLIISAYLENFQPDTTPILPDLLHPKQTARNLGGFLEGKALLTDDAGHVLSVGSFLCEAFLDTTNHAVIRLPNGSLKGSFTLNKKAFLNGTLSGTIRLTARQRAQVLANRGAKLGSLKKIINTVSVHPAPMMGRSTKGNPRAALHTGYGTSKTVRNGTGFQPSPTQSGPKISLITILTGTGAILCFLVAAGLFLMQRRAPT